MSEGTMSIYVGTRTMKAAGQDEGTDESEMYGKVSGKAYFKAMRVCWARIFYQETSEYQTQINKPEIQSLKIETPKKGKFLVVFCFCCCRRRNAADYYRTCDKKQKAENAFGGGAKGGGR